MIYNQILFQSNCFAPNYQLIIIDFDHTPNSGNIENQDIWPMTTLIAECKDQVLEWAACVNEDKLIICYLKDVKNVLYVHDLSTGDRLHQIPLEIGSVTGVSADKRYSEWFYTFNSTIIPR